MIALTQSITLIMEHKRSHCVQYFSIYELNFDGVGCRNEHHGFSMIAPAQCHGFLVLSVRDDRHFEAHIHSGRTVRCLLLQVLLHVVGTGEVVEGDVDSLALLALYEPGTVQRAEAKFGRHCACYVPAALRHTQEFVTMTKSSVSVFHYKTNRENVSDLSIGPGKIGSFTSEV